MADIVANKCAFNQILDNQLTHSVPWAFGANGGLGNVGPWAVATLPGWLSSLGWRSIHANLTNLILYQQSTLL